MSTATERVYRTTDGRYVPHGHEDAASLVAGVGGQLPADFTGFTEAPATPAEVEVDVPPAAAEVEVDNSIAEAAGDFDDLAEGLKSKPAAKPKKKG